MKKILFLLLVTTGFQSFAQFNTCCPYISTIEVIPANPTTADNIKIVTFVATPNNGHLIGSSFSVSQNTVTAEACYYSGFLTVITEIYDTLEIGMLNSGTYSFDFTASISYDEFTCTHSDSNVVSDNFTVTGSNSGLNEETLHDLQVIPNPNNGNFKLHNSGNETITRVSINTIDGKVIKSVPFKDFMTESLPTGNYFLHFYDENEFLGAKRVIVH